MFIRTRSSILEHLSSLNLLRSCALNTSSGKNDNPAVIIPKRIERGPTDILQALASTVGRDPTAAHYKFHDDPFLIPMSNVGKRTFAMAQESGRKAAKWVVNEHPELFSHKVAEPPIEIFTPKAIYNEKSDVGEDTLLKVISNGQVGDSIIIYNLLKSKKKDVSIETKQALLELVCFYNEVDGIPEEFIEERWFSLSNQKGKQVDVSTKTWKDNGVAETIFKSFTEPSPAAYSAIIQGMAKYGQVERAWMYYEATQDKKMVLDVGVYNALLAVVNGLKQGHDLRWQLLENLLSSMAAEKIKPNIGTLNSALTSLSGIGGPEAIQKALGCIAEFRLLGIEPSLGTYYLLFQILGRDRTSTVNKGQLLSDILDVIEGHNLEIQHPLDTSFFVKAMEICRFFTPDFKLAHRVDGILHYADNYNLIGDSFAESIYYRNFFFHLCATETIENIMEMYNALVPNIYTPEPAVVEELLKTFDLSGTIEHLPRFWADMVAFDHSDRERLVAQFLDIMVRNEPAPESNFIKTFAEIAYQIWNKIENQPANRVNVIIWSGEMLSHVMLLLTRNGDLEKASDVMKKLNNDHSYIGEPQIEALCGYMDLCIVNNDFNRAIDCLQYCKNAGRPEIASMGKDLRNRLPLTDNQAQVLTELIELE